MADNRADEQASRAARDGGRSLHYLAGKQAAGSGADRGEGGLAGARATAASAAARRRNCRRVIPESRRRSRNRRNIMKFQALMLDLPGQLHEPGLEGRALLGRFKRDAGPARATKAHRSAQPVA